MAIAAHRLHACMQASWREHAKGLGTQDEFYHSLLLQRVKIRLMCDRKGCRCDEAWASCMDLDSERCGWTASATTLSATDFSCTHGTSLDWGGHHEEIDTLQTRRYQSKEYIFVAEYNTREVEMVTLPTEEAPESL
ncbi:hypothetical protein CIHG_08576 [Coccidioides immitis H538.4]|uniref:Uncharacterized protein n=1 Tax=Coccidioides immitis H538.4 TaxID=396776 RepID=A0A0J8S0J3_COCIT|nr:hypothetical protein CIHG_08576 [Coccidioides immitis H538.4]